MQQLRKKINKKVRFFLLLSFIQNSRLATIQTKASLKLLYALNKISLIVASFVCKLARVADLASYISSNFQRNTILSQQNVKAQT